LAVFHFSTLGHLLNMQPQDVALHHTTPLYITRGIRRGIAVTAPFSIVPWTLLCAAELPVAGAATRAPPHPHSLSTPCTQNSRSQLGLPPARKEKTVVIDFCLHFEVSAGVTYSSWLHWCRSIVYKKVSIGLWARGCRSSQLSARWCKPCNSRASAEALQPSRSVTPYFKIILFNPIVSCTCVNMPSIM
jgi:hypothetical protein